MKMKPSRIVLAGVLVLLFVAFFQIFNRDQDDVQEPTFPALLSKIEEKKVRQVRVRGHTYSGVYQDTRERFRTIGPPADWVMLQKLRESGVDVKYEKEELHNLWLTVLLQWMPVVLLVVAFRLARRRLHKVTIVLVGVLVLLFVCFFHIFSRPMDEIEEPSFTEFLAKVEQKKIREVSIRRSWYSGVYEDTHEKFRTYGPAADPATVQKLRDLGVEVRVDPEGR